MNHPSRGAMRAARAIIEALAGCPCPPELIADIIERETALPAFCEAAREFASWEVVHGSTLPSPACLQTIKGQFGDLLKGARASAERA